MELSLNLGFADFSSSSPDHRGEKIPAGNGDYLRSLEDEMKKIEPFRRELPLCMILLENSESRSSSNLLSIFVDLIFFFF